MYDPLLTLTRTGYYGRFVLKFICWSVSKGISTLIASFILLYGAN